MPVVPREPVTDHVTFAFVGGGFAGLVTGARLAEAGITDYRIIEKGGDFGGTWYWNRYPGAQCDTASMIYIPLLEETGHRPTEKYAHGPEILEQCRRIGRQYGLYDKALFHTQIRELSWDQARQLWEITTDRDDRFTAKYVGIGTGPLHIPKLPGIPGIERFQGQVVPHQPLGLCLYRRRRERRADDGPGRQARRDHRHRRDLGPGGAAPRARGEGTLRRPAHAVVGRCPRQRADRPRLVRRDRDAGLAAPLAGEFHRQPDAGHDGRGGSGRGRLDRHFAADQGARS